MGGYNYLFDDGGQLESLQRLTAPILESVVPGHFEHPAAAMAAYARRASSMEDNT